MRRPPRLLSALTQCAFALAVFIQTTALGAPLRWGSTYLKQDPEWYASAGARAAADNIILHQSEHGGWPKNADLALAPNPDGASDPKREKRSATADTIDNHGTTMPLRFLALMVTATGEGRYRASFERGIDFLLTAQYPNGGWPQFFPLRKGYYSHITYNDNAMINVMTLLRDVAEGRPPFAFVSAERRGSLAASVARGIDCILRTQVRQDGKLAAWCAQHDEQTLEPAWARRFEPPSLSGYGTVAIVRFLMQTEEPESAVVAAIEGAVDWLEEVAIRGMRLEEFVDANGRDDIRLVPAGVPGDAPALWARFYELGTNRPLFVGRDGEFRYAFQEIEYERRNGYDYLGSWPARLLERDLPRWRERRGGTS